VEAVTDGKARWLEYSFTGAYQLTFVNTAYTGGRNYALSLAMDAFATGTLGVDGLLERRVSIQQDVHQSTLFPVRVLDAALALGKLLVITALPSRLRKE